MATREESREGLSYREAALRLGRPVWFVDAVEAVKAPYDEAVAKGQVELRPEFFGAASW